MNNFKIGAMADSFRLPMKDALRKIKSMDIQGFQMYVVSGEYSPENFTKANQIEFKKFVADLGLEISALCGDFGFGFYYEDRNREIIEKSKRVLDMAVNLGTKVVTTHIGVVPKDMNCERFFIMQKACEELAKAADNVGVRFAVETGPEESLTLKNFLDTLGSKGVSVNLDPANLVMVTGDDPVKAVYNLKDYIVHTHAKDGKMLTKTKPEYIYGLEKAPKDLPPAFIETPLGTGSVDFPKYIEALRDIGYNGYLTIEREVGENPEADIATARDFLKKLI